MDHVSMNAVAAEQPAVDDAVAPRAMRRTVVWSNARGANTAGLAVIGVVEGQKVP